MTRVHGPDHGLLAHQLQLHLSLLCSNSPISAPPAFLYLLEAAQVSLMLSKVLPCLRLVPCWLLVLARRFLGAVTHLDLLDRL